MSISLIFVLIFFIVYRPCSTLGKCRLNVCQFNAVTSSFTVTAVKELTEILIQYLSTSPVKMLLNFLFLPLQ
jgi:hypothetical protein